MLEAAEFKRRLVRALKARPTISHPVFAEFMRPEPNMELAKIFACQTYLLTSMFERYISAIFYRCPVREFRTKLAENLYEEVTGRLSKTDGHLELMERFIVGIGIPRAELEATVASPETRDLIEYRAHLVDDPAQFHKAAAAVMIASEGQTIQRKDGRPAYEVFAKRYNLTEDQLAFFSVHAAEDVEHVQDGLELTTKVCTTAQMQDEAIAAVATTCEKFWNFYSGIERTFAESRSAGGAAAALS